MKIQTINSKNNNYTAEKHPEGWVVFSNETNFPVSGYTTKKYAIEIMESKERSLSERIIK